MEHIIHLEGGKLHNDTNKTDVANIVKNAVTQGKIVIHLHGGLVSFNSGKNIASSLTPEYKSAEAYPIFFLWESGLIEAIVNNLDEIVDEKIFKVIWKRLSKIVLRKMNQDSGQRSSSFLPNVDSSDIERDIDRAVNERDSRILNQQAPDPDDLTNELTAKEVLTLEQELQYDVELINEIKALNNSLKVNETTEKTRGGAVSRSRKSISSLIDPEKLDELIEGSKEGERGILSVAKFIKAVVSISAKVISRFIKKRDHGFHATIIEEILRELYVANIGAKVWELMKKDTEDAFKPNGGGTVFINTLKDYDIKEINFVCHSAGSIFLTHFIENLVKEKLDIEYNVAFLAPAITFEKMSNFVEDHESVIRNFRMFTMLDVYEKRDILVPVIYPHSLLYFISGVLERAHDKPVLGMERFYNHNHFPDKGFKEIKAARDFINKHQTCWSITSKGEDGKLSSAEKHGDFDNDTLTIESLKYLLLNNFQ